MFLCRNKKNNLYPCKHQFYYIKVGFKGVRIIQACFRDATEFRPAYIVARLVERPLCVREVLVDPQLRHTKMVPATLSLCAQH